jgi:hypothetical protein
MSVRELGFRGGRLVELSQDRVQWWDLVLAALKLRVLLPDS